MDPAIAAWINSQPLSAEAKAALLADASFEAVYKDNILTRADYSRQSDALRREIEAEKAAAAEERRRAEALINQNTDWRSTTEAQYNQAVQRAQEAEQRVLRLQQTLRDKYDLSPEALKELDLDKPPLTTPTPAPTSVTPTGDPNAGKYLTADELAKRELANFNVMAAVRKAERDHLKLFGNLDDFDETAILDHAFKSGAGSFTAAWEEKYKVPEKRKEIEVAEWNRKIEAARTEAKQQALAEAELGRQNSNNLLSDRPDVPPGMNQFDRVMNPTNPTNTNTAAEGTINAQAAKNARMSRAMQANADYRSGKIPAIGPQSA